MQFTTFVSSIAAAGVLLASDAAGQQATTLSTATIMPAASSDTLSFEPTLASEVARPTTGARRMKTHKVMVSDDQGTLKFTPDVVNAQPGHMVEFMFHPGNFSVAQAAFDQPCVPMEVAMPSMTGFFSGFNPVSSGESKIFQIMVNDTNPIWYYDAQSNNCQAGMVGAINPPANSSSENIEIFAAAAKNATSNMVPSRIEGGVEHTGFARASGSGRHSGAAKGTGKMHIKGSGRVGGVAEGSGRAMKTVSAAASKVVVSTIVTVAPQAQPMAMQVSVIKSVPPIDPPTAPSGAAANAGASGNGNNGAGAPAQAQAAVAPSSASSAAEPSGTIKKANGASTLSSGSPLSLIGLLAAAFYIYA